MKTFEANSALRDSIYLASGSTYPELTNEIAENMGIEAQPMELRQFPNSELYVRYEESVRRDQVFAIQALAAVNGKSVNDSFMELVLMVDAAKRASADEVTVVAPYLAYSRQDRKARGREPISAAMIIRTLGAAGADRIVSVDMHSPQTQATFYGPFDHLTAEPLLKEALEKQVSDNQDGHVMVSPDVGGYKTAVEYSNYLEVDMVHIPKARRREKSSEIERPKRVKGVNGKDCIIVDDMVDTAGTLVSAAETLANSGANSVTFAATHGLFSDPALERLEEAPIDKLIVTDTVPQKRVKEALGERLRVLPIAPIIAEAIWEIAAGGSVSRMFNDRNHH